MNNSHCGDKWQNSGSLNLPLFPMILSNQPFYTYYHQAT